MSGPVVAVVGAGFSGTALTLQLLRHAGPDVRVRLIERAARFGPGLAYGTTHPLHLLNVMAARMGAFPDRPDHFHRWLRARPGHADVQPGDYVQRCHYGAYLQDLLAHAQAGAPGCLERIVGEAVALTDDAGIAITLADGRTVRADAAVLATGNVSPLPPRGIDPARLGRFWAPDPWRQDMLAGLAPDDPVLLLGTGLTMADAAVMLLDAGHRGPIHALSRRGLLPRRHVAGPPAAAPAAGYPPRLMDLLRFVRRQVRESATPWQPVLDPLRPALVGLWCGATPAERSRFLRHLRPWWDTHRHRLPAATAERLDAAQARGQLRPRAGRVESATPDGDRVRVLFRPRGAQASETLAVARVVNCTGPAADYARIADPLIRSLLDAGTIRPDPLRLGLDIDDDLALRRADGTPSTRLFALGPVLRASVWEMTSVPDLRHEAERLAIRLASRIRAPGEGYAAPR